MSREFGGQSAVAPLKKALVRRPQWTPGARQPWRSGWGYEREPDLAKAQQEHDVFVEKLKAFGTAVYYLEGDAPELYDLVFTHDRALMTNRGAIILWSGKPGRQGEEVFVGRALRELGIPIVHEMKRPMTADGGDFLWLREDLLLVGRSYRTNAGHDEGFVRLLNEMGVEVRCFGVPHWTGREDVMHLTSFISLVDRDLAVAYRRVMPVEMVELLDGEGIKFVDVTDEEFDMGLGANVLAVAPRKCLMLAGYEGVKRRLEAAGAQVEVFGGNELSHCMKGGATCMTLSLLRFAESQVEPAFCHDILGGRQSPM